MESSDEMVRLRVEGRVAGPWLDELRTTCNEHVGPDPRRLQLDLEDVHYADCAGVIYLKELREQGVGLLCVSPFLAELFKNDSLPDGC